MKSNRVVLLVVALMLCSIFLVPVVWSAATCPQGFDDCDGKSSTKCETNLMTNLAHCGRCGNACGTFPNSITTCRYGICGLTCMPGWGNCDGNAANGCETYLIDNPNHCGWCENFCSPAANATATCGSGGCGFTCLPGWGNCDGNAANGCETQLSSNQNNCGACGRVCPPAANATATCRNAACGFTCLPGWGNCDGNPLNGCESNLITNALNCGACGTKCAAGMLCGAGRCESVR